MDIKSVFVNDFIEEEVYVEQRPGFNDPTWLVYDFALLFHIFLPIYE